MQRSLWKAEYAAKRQWAREKTRNGILTTLPEKGALDDSDADRKLTYDERWKQGGFNFMASYNNLGIDKAANDTASDFVRSKIAELVHDPEVAKLLQPDGYPIGSKRICVDTDYFAIFNRPNVSLVDLPTQKWAEGPRTYLGLMSAGFPNMFIITGPGSPSVLSNMIVSIEQHVEWITDCVSHMRAQGFVRIDAVKEAEDGWVMHVNDVAHTTLHPQAKSWYMGANIPGKPRIFMPYIGGIGVYRQICDDVVAKGYEGFELTEPGLMARDVAE